MPKRKNHRWEQVITFENCYAAVEEVLRNRHFPALGSRLHTPNRRDIERIIRHRAKHPPKPGYITWCMEHKEEVARQVQADLANDTWEPKPYRTRVITDKLRGKERHLKMPCLYDQFIHHAVLRVMIPTLQKRFCYYSCGSVPGAGQKRAVDGAKRFFAAKKGGAKYGASCDVRHFYETCSGDVVMQCLARVFKDKKLLAVNRMILDSMGGSLAIGFFPSPWYANLVLDILVDKPLAEKFGKDIRYVRFADDMLMAGRNRRRLHQALAFIQSSLKLFGMELKPNYQVYPVKRGAAFLSYRFFKGYTLIRKQILYRITRAAKRAGKGISPDLARRLCSYKGIMLPADSYTVFKQYFTRDTWKKARRVISYVDVFCRETAEAYHYAAA